MFRHLAVAARTVYQSNRSFFIQVGTSGALAAIGDFSCQKFIQEQEWDMMRTVRFSLITLCMIAPLQYNWFKVLNKIEGAPVTVGLKRMLVDQIFAAPLFNAFFFIVMGLFEGHSLSSAFLKTKLVIKTVLISNYKIWPFVQFINMSVMPLHLRLVFVQLISIFWNMYISYENAKANILNNENVIATKETGDIQM